MVALAAVVAVIVVIVVVIVRGAALNGCGHSSSGSGCSKWQY